MTAVHESTVEYNAQGQFERLGYSAMRGVDIDEAGERAGPASAILETRLGAAVERLNPHLSHDVVAQVVRTVTTPPHPTLEQNNRWLHGLYTDGVEVEYRDSKSGERRGGRARPIDFDTPQANDWLVVRQLTIVGPSGKHIRPDLVVFLNGLPVGVIELKDPTDESATLGAAVRQFQRYKRTVPDFFVPNVALAVSDGLLTRIGSLTAGASRFMPWRPEHGGTPTLQALVEGLFAPERFLDYLQHCVVFEENERGDITKKIAGYHQFRAVRKARGSVLQALQRSNVVAESPHPKSLSQVPHPGPLPGSPHPKSLSQGERDFSGRGGVVWHTQGSGKSLTMLMLAGALIREPAMENPTIVMVTDRNDLDDQLFETFAGGRALLRQMPVQAESREHLKELLDRASGGVVFTTIHKFVDSREEGALTSDSKALTPTLSQGEREFGEFDAEHFRGGRSFSTLLEQARELRQRQTPAEEVLWEMLRDRRLAGAKFRRQHQFGPYILDFYCAEARLAVECDGAVHLDSDQREHDLARDANLRAEGVTVLRFWNYEVLRETERVLGEIARQLPGALTPDPSSPEALAPVPSSVDSAHDPYEALTPDPSPRGRGGMTRADSEDPPSPPGRGVGGEGSQVAEGEGSPARSYGSAPPTPISTRWNVVVMADEAHRSQYGFVEGGARWMREALPNATFVGFTGTPLERDDKNTIHVFGPYSDVYDIRQAVEDGATKPLYYESRIVKLRVDEAAASEIEETLREAAEASAQGEDVDESVRVPLEALVGAQERVERLAAFIVEHWEKRRAAMEGKAMVVTMSRDIAARLYPAIRKLRPAWHDDDDERGAIKIVMTGSASDDAHLLPHVRTKTQRKRLADRFKDPADDFRLVIVVDMWLTGFDVPAAHTMYLDKPLAGHNLMQGIARVNRVYGDKPGGLIVDLIGLADQLADALATYTQAGGTGEAIRQVQDEAVPAMQSAFEKLQAFFHECDYAPALRRNEHDVLNVYLLAIDHVLGENDGWKRFRTMVKDLSAAFALAVPRPETEAVVEHLAFFQRVQAMIRKRLADDSGSNGRGRRDVDHAVRQIIGDAVDADDVVDLFAAAGLGEARLDVLSDEFLGRVAALEQKNLALETLRKLLNDQIRITERTNLVQSRKFREALEEAMLRYNNKAITTAEMIARLIDLAQELKRAREEGKALGLSQEEIAFYDALAENGSAKEVMKSDDLRLMARKLTEMVRAMPKLDWDRRESVRADLRRKVRRLLALYGYPPDLSEDATQLVLRQAELSTENGA